jgi:phage tail-like protein
MPGPTVTEALTGYQFYLELDGITEAMFKEVSGLSSESQVIEHLQATKDGRQVLKKYPGPLKWGDITLKRGITNEMNLWAWRQQIEQGKVESSRKDGSIVVYNQANEEIARWNFVGGWPSKISGPSLTAGGSDVALEELTLVHEGLERVK